MISSHFGQDYFQCGTPKQNGWHGGDDLSKCIFMDEYLVSIYISLKFVCS